MKAIVIAAGRGRRLAPHTDEMPKCLVPIRGRPMLVRQLDAFRAHRLTEFVIVRGYRAEVLERRRAELGAGVRFVENRDWERNNILQSLFTAEAELDGPVLLTYADIVFAQELVGQLLDAPGDVCLVIDRDFAKVYEGRTEHPLEEAEVAVIDDDGRVRAVGKRAVPVAQASGEFIGLARLTARGVEALRAAYAEARDQHEKTGASPFARNSWQGAYLTDLLERLIELGVDVRAVPIHGRWREIDTEQDLLRAEQSVDW